MNINRTTPDLWKKDVKNSVDYYNSWFLSFAPDVYKTNRRQVASTVKDTISATSEMRILTGEVLIEHPEMLPTLRMSTCPPIARDRLIGLSDVQKNIVKSMEDKKHPRIPVKMKKSDIDDNLKKICNTINSLVDKELFNWLESGEDPKTEDIERASLIIADRLCGAVSDPIIRNAQEERQLSIIKAWLEKKGYIFVDSKKVKIDSMEPGTFTFRHNIPVFVGKFGSSKKVNIPVDVVIMKKTSHAGTLPLLIEAKSAGDFTNVNKRRKEEATKMSQLKTTYGSKVEFILFLCGYFDTGYLGYEAAEGIDWVWEHRIDDLEKAGL